ncbi:hypothetical protein [Longitalea arenae]|uniref:hypothetical protein n=1 Tax=Longitalea arenae TaxID=2812558 RepID=UPI0019676606|nr:hypothetical protein [Longitalea arenae]
MALLIVCTAACKKEEEKGLTEKLMNKWSLVQILDTTYTSTAAAVPNKYEGKTGEYMDFRTDGKLYSFINGTYDTASYTYSEKNLKVNVQGFKYNIVMLTDHSMVLHEPRYASATVDYKSYKIVLKR